MQYEKIKFTMDWWTTYYDFGLKRQPTITPGSILVELKAQAARAATEKDAERGATNDRNGSKKSKRSNAAIQKSALSNEDVKV